MSNKTICDMTRMENIEKLLREQKIQWFGHMKRMDDKRAPVKARKNVLKVQKKYDQQKDRKR